MATYWMLHCRSLGFQVVEACSKSAPSMHHGLQPDETLKGLPTGYCCKLPNLEGFFDGRHQLVQRIDACPVSMGVACQDVDYTCSRTDQLSIDEQSEYMTCLATLLLRSASRAEHKGGFQALSHYSKASLAPDGLHFKSDCTVFLPGKAICTSANKHPAAARSDKATATSPAMQSKLISLPGSM